MPRLIVENLYKEYPTRDEPLVVLRDVNLRLDGGDSLAILGPSGSGKSTLLHILGTLDQPSSGTVRLDNNDPSTMDEPKLAQFRNEKIGFVFQQHYLLPQLTALENILVPALASGSVTDDVDAHARSLVDRVGLTDRIHHRPAEMSGGEQQRVAVARALVNRPSLILADEPTGNLDRGNALGIAQLLTEIQAESQASAVLVVVTHSEEIAGHFAGQRVLSGGTLMNRANAVTDHETA